MEPRVGQDGLEQGEALNQSVLREGVRKVLDKGLAHEKDRSK